MDACAVGPGSRMAADRRRAHLTARALVVGGLGNMTWLLQGRRALAIRRGVLLADAAPTPALPSDPYPEQDGVRFAVPGTSRHHRAGCAAIAGKQVESMSAAQHERAGRRACGLCGG